MAIPTSMYTYQKAIREYVITLTVFLFIAGRTFSLQFSSFRISAESINKLIWQQSASEAVRDTEVGVRLADLNFQKC
jgi:hypothetical protein